MRTFHLAFAALALSMDGLEAVKTSGLLRERTHGVERALSSKGSKGKGSDSSKGKGKGKGYEYESPSCPAPVSKGSKGKGSKGSKGKGSKGKGSDDSGKGKGSKGTRFLEELQEQDERRLSKGKGSSGSGKGKGSSGVDDGCDCNASKDTCTESDTKVVCGGLIDNEYVTLKTSLGCDAQDDVPVLTVRGPNGVLDCRGDGDNMIYDVTPDPSTTTIGIRLEDGGTAIGCFVSGFEVGVQMGGEGPNTLIGATLFNNLYGVETQDGNGSVDPDISIGCYTVECTTIVGEEISEGGIFVRHSGDMIIKNTDILGVGNGPSLGIKPFSGNTLTVATEDVNIFVNRGGNNDGVKIYGDGVVEALDIYGKLKIVASDNIGILNEQAATVSVFGDLEIHDADLNGLESVSTGDFLLVGEALFCNNQGIDIVLPTSDDFFNMDGTNDNLVCEIGTNAPCPSNAMMCTTEISTADACTAGAGKGSKGSKGGKGSSKGGKGSSKGGKGSSKGGKGSTP